MRKRVGSSPFIRISSKKVPEIILEDFFMSDSILYIDRDVVLGREFSVRIIADENLL